MKGLSISLLPTLVATAALAHPSAVMHEHPHGASALLGLDVLALVVLAAASVCILLQKYLHG